MEATQAQRGKLYRVTKCPQWEYLTVGEIYECTQQTRTSMGFHRPNGGAGTYLMGAGLKAVEVELVTPPYPFCVGNPTKADCVLAGYCKREIACNN